MLLITKRDTQVEILVKNTYSKLPDLNGLYKNGYSTKGRGRGQGLSSLKKIIKKYKQAELVLRAEKIYFVHGIKFQS